MKKAYSSNNCMPPFNTFFITCKSGAVHPGCNSPPYGLFIMPREHTIFYIFKNGLTILTHSFKFPYRIFLEIALFRIIQSSINLLVNFFPLKFFLTQLVDTQIFFQCYYLIMRKNFGGFFISPPYLKRILFKVVIPQGSFPPFS